MSATYENEAELMRFCGHLYASIAIESLATTIMSLTFTYLLLLITNKGRLRSPGQAAMSFITSQIASFVKDAAGEVLNWGAMKGLPLEKRFALCRKANQAICSFQILIGVLTVERWLHINNVNGFRYLGYAITCPPMQVELIILIAPVVPCYKLQCYFTYIITMVMLLTGYASSLIQSELYDGSMGDFLKTWDLSKDLKPNLKFWLFFVSAMIQVYLTFLQIPYLALLYKLKGGIKGGLPHGYLKLLLIVSVSWLAFPAWWCLSYEGMSVITDTKLNAAGFAILNVLSKGSFTLQMLSITAWHRREKKRAECIAKGRRPSQDGKTGLFDPDSHTVEELEPVQRKESRAETWLVRVLRPYERNEPSAQAWQVLDPMYRAYLVGNGITPSTWTSMTSQQRGGLKESYESTLDLVMAEQVTDKLDEGGLHDKHVSHPETVVVPAEQRPEKIFDEPPTADALAPLPPGRRRQPGGLRIGQTITTVQGYKGRVLKIGEDEVQITDKISEEPRTVRLEDITALKVAFVGARGLRAADPSGQMQFFCSALIQGRPSSEVQTGVTGGGGLKVMWDHEDLEVQGLGPGDSVALRLWGRDPITLSDEVMGEAVLTGESLAGDGFEGELQLSDGGSEMRAYLGVMITPSNLPRCLFKSTAVEEPAQPIARPVIPEEIDYSTQPGFKSHCCT